MDKTELIEIFNDTQRFYETNEKLENAIQASKKATKLYEADEYPVIDRSDIINGHVKGSGVKEAGDASTHTAALTKHRTFEAAMKIHAVHPDWKIAVLLGAFGCGAFMNDPEVVARAYREVLKEYGQYFKLVEFAVYCKGHETVNYDAFRRVLTGQR